MENRDLAAWFADVQGQTQTLVHALGAIIALRFNREERAIIIASLEKMAEVVPGNAEFRKAYLGGSAAVIEGLRVASTAKMHSELLRDLAPGGQN